MYRYDYNQQRLFNEDYEGNPIEDVAPEAPITPATPPSTEQDTTPQGGQAQAVTPPPTPKVEEKKAPAVNPFVNTTTKVSSTRVGQADWQAMRNAEAARAKAENDRLYNTLEGITGKRKRLEEARKKDEAEHRKGVKILALGKMLNALAQIAFGGGNGTVQKDADPYMINAFNKLKELRADYAAQDSNLAKSEAEAYKALEDARKVSASNAFKIDLAEQQAAKENKVTTTQTQTDKMGDANLNVQKKDLAVEKYKETVPYRKQVIEYNTNAQARKAKEVADYKHDKDYSSSGGNSEYQIFPGIDSERINIKKSEWEKNWGKMRDLIIQDLKLDEKEEKTDDPNFGSKAWTEAHLFQSKSALEYLRNIERSRNGEKVSNGVANQGIAAADIWKTNPLTDGRIEPSNYVELNPTRRAKALWVK